MKKISAQKAESIAAQAKDILNLYGSGKVVRHGANVVFRFDNAYLKIHLSCNDKDLVDQQIRFIEYLKANDFCVAEPYVSESLIIEGYLCSASKPLECSEITNRAEDIGNFVRLFHQTSNQFPETVPEWKTFQDCSNYIDYFKTTNIFSQEILEIFQTEITRIIQSLDDNPNKMDWGINHGDLNLGNLLVNNNNQYCLLDFDDLCSGSQAIDLSKRLSFHKVGRISEKDLNDFFESYQLNKKYLPEIESLADLRLIADTLRLGFLETDKANREICYREKYYLSNCKDNASWSKVW